MAVFQPLRVVKFLLAVLEPIAAAAPNSAHRAIAALEDHVLTTVITQNVDGLHQDAGSVRVREIHGSFLELATLNGRFLRRLARADLRRLVLRLRRVRSGPFTLPRLAFALAPWIGFQFCAIRRPRLVLFGDQLEEPAWDWAQKDLIGCKVLLVVGTSGLVMPAALVPHLAKEQGTVIIQVDPHDPGNGDLWLRGSAAEAVPRLVELAFS
jgi:NAD-dependent deacetylase